MELHSNQIRWEAPEPHKFNFDKPDYTPLANSLNYLSGVSQDIADRLNAMEDDKLEADVKLAEDEANKAIEDADSATADYDQLSEMALSKVQGAFYKYNEAARVRFTRKHNTYFDELQLAISDKLLKKKAQQLENDVEINIPQWTTVALNQGKAGLEWMLNEKIAKTLEGVSSPEKIASLQFKAKHMYDTASVNNGLNGDEAAIKKTMSDLKNPKIYDTLNAYERSVSYSSGKNKLESLEKAKKKEDDPNLKLLSRMYATYSSQQDEASQDKLYKQIVGLDPSPIVIGEEIDENGVPQPKLLYMDSYSMDDRLDFATKLSNAYDKYNGSMKIRQNLYENDLRKMLTEYKEAEANSSSDRAHVIINLNNMRYDVNRYSKVDETTRQDIDALIDNEISARIEALNVPDFYADNILWSGEKATNINPGVELVRRIATGQEPASGKSQADWALGKDVAATARSDGGLLQDVIQTWKGDFDKDMGRDTVSEYALVSTFVLKAFRDAGKLQGTRLAQPDRVYVESLMLTMNGLLESGDYNKRIRDEDVQKVESLYTNFLVSPPTDEEKQIISQIDKWASTAQASRDSYQLWAYLTRPEPGYTREDQDFKMGGAYLQPAKDMLDTIWRGSKTRKEITDAEKRAKNAND